MRKFLAAILILLLPSVSFAQDNVDVRGGFFSKEQTNRDIFSPSHSRSSNAIEEEEIELEGGDTFQVQENAVAPKPAPPQPQPQQVNPHVRNPEEAINRAASIIEKMKGMDQNMSDLKSLSSTIENMKGENIAPSHSLTPPPSSPKQVKTQAPVAINGEQQSIKGPAKISLIVNGADHLHLEKNLDRLKAVQSRYGVAIGDVSLVGAVDYQLVEMKHLAYAKDSPRVKVAKGSYPRKPKELKKWIMKKDKKRLALLSQPTFSSEGRNKVINMSDEEFDQVLQNSASDEVKQQFLSREQKRFLKNVDKISHKELEMLNDFSDSYILGDVKDNRELPKSMRQFAEVGLLPSGVNGQETRLAELGVSKSPVWIIEAGGKKYVFEGNYDPRDMFTPDGEFLPPKPGF